MNMNNTDSITPMRIHFIAYLTLLGQNGLSWELNSSENDAGQHIIGIIRTAKLRYRLESNLNFIHAHVKQRFKKLFKHAQKIADDFALLNNKVLQNING